MDLDITFYIQGLFECIKWNNVNITKSVLIAFRDLIYSNNEALIKVRIKSSFNI